MPLTTRTIRRIASCGAVVLTGLLAAPAVAGDWPPAQFVRHAGAAGGDALYLPMGDVLNVRNIQGGYQTGRRADLNLDLGAGNSTQRGDVVVNWDVGNRTLIYDGHKHLVASFSAKRVRFYVPVVFAHRH